MKVVELPVNNLMDIPGMLRKYAADIEDHPEIAVRVVIVSEDDHEEISCRGYGDAGDIIRMIGLLEKGKHELLSMKNPGR